MRRTTTGIPCPVPGSRGPISLNEMRVGFFAAVVGVMFLLLSHSCYKKPSLSPEVKASIEKGRFLYNIVCMRCHQAEGIGLPGAYPPLAKSDYMMADLDRSIHHVLFGMEGEIVVNGETYVGTMEKLELYDEEIADVMTFLRVEWNEGGGPVTAEQVRKVRAAGK